MSDTAPAVSKPEGGNGKMEQEPKPLRKVLHMDHRTAFTSTQQMDRWKEYIKDIPILRARLITAVTSLEMLVEQQREQVVRALEAHRAFEEATKEITARFSEWEKEKAHGTEHSATGTGSATSPDAPAAAPDSSGPSGHSG